MYKQDKRENCCARQEHKESAKRWNTYKKEFRDDEEIPDVVQFKKKTKNIINGTL